MVIQQILFFINASMGTADLCQYVDVIDKEWLYSGAYDVGPWANELIEVSKVGVLLVHVSSLICLDRHNIGSVGLLCRNLLCCHN